jgi:hypothetical protein
MTFVFPFLLGGLALVGIPVLIHLIMRRKPKVVPFPAFRFLVQRHRINQRKLRLRHLLLLALRVLVIVVICLALARPRVSSEALKLGGDRPVAAVLVFDTSPSMEYTVSSAKGKLTRLDDARRRGSELLDQLPDGSKVLILDTADPPVAGKGEWLASMPQAQKRINGLRLRPGGGPVTARVEDAYRVLGDLARDRGDSAGPNFARLLVVFSDRTRACWDSGRSAHLQEACDQVPAPFERLPQLRDRAPAVVELLRGLRQRLPLPPGADYPEQALIDLLEKGRDLADRITEDEYPDRALSQLLAGARGRARELLRGLEKVGPGLSGDAKEYHGKLTEVLSGLLHELRGAHEIFIDVGVDNPADGAVLDFELPRDPRHNVPRQAFAADERVVVRVPVLASGKPLANTLRLTLTDPRSSSKTPPTRKEEYPFELKAGEKRAFGFEIDCKKLAPGEHQLRAELVNPDLLPGNNARHLTFAIRQPRNVLVVADEPRKALRWQDAHEALRGAGVEYRVTVASPDGLLKDNPGVLKKYQAVYLFGVAEPSDALWELLQEYVTSGGGLGVVPGGEEMKLNAYDTAKARAVLPGRLERVINADAAREARAGQWDWERLTYGHPLMARFREWKAERVDFVKYPRTASRFWLVKPQGKDTTVLARYADREHSPALLERPLGGGGRPGRVVLFTTTLDRRKQPWNDYESTRTAFYVALAYQTTRHLAGDSEAVRLNFVSGQAAPVVNLPLGQRLGSYELLRDGALVEAVTAESGQNVLRLPQAVVPGNYVIHGEGKPVAAFSVNLSAEEAVLDRLPVAEVEALFGKGAVVPVDVRADLRAAMSGQWGQPEEMLPWLLVALLFALAVENLLANKFYRREADGGTG